MPYTAFEIDSFTNEPFTDFSDPKNVEAFQDALDRTAAKLPVVASLWIDGEDRESGETFTSVDPGDTERIVCNCAQAGESEALAAIAGAHKAFGPWSRRSPEERADYLFRAAKLMRERKHDFSAMMVYEVGKSWAEADGDTAEAIDFMEFYAREALRYGGPQPITPIKGERNELRYIPIGIGAVIPPWNFPLAILVGMTTAALVTGNTVCLKPSSDSPGIASMFLDLLKEVGIPGGTLQFVPGPGSSVGNTLVEHAQTRFISFTGSKEVGLGIYEKAGKTPEGQIWLKRVVAEMGGKDFIYVHEDADLDAAAKGAASAAFGYQGQKCSACSRLLLHEKIHDEFMEKLLPEVEKIQVGHPSDSKNFMGPMINESARQLALDAIKIAKKDGTLVAGGEVAEGNGWYLQPTVFTDMDRTHHLSKTEIFAPVLAVLKVGSFDEAVDVANDTEYGLTGAAYVKDRELQERAATEFHAGNFYINRKCTGALVGVHPFGGFNMSGTDSKAGGRDYLLLFLQAKSISRAV